MNGGLILGTLDGVNIEIMEEIGRENMFIFGSSSEEVALVVSLLAQTLIPAGQSTPSTTRTNQRAPVSRSQVHLKIFLGG